MRTEHISAIRFFSGPDGRGRSDGLGGSGRTKPRRTAWTWTNVDGQHGRHERGRTGRTGRTWTRVSLAIIQVLEFPEMRGQIMDLIEQWHFADELDTLLEQITEMWQGLRCRHADLLRQSDYPLHKTAGPGEGLACS